jgi:lysozyme
LKLSFWEEQMHLSSAGLELLKRSEGFRSRTYLDSAGFQTIGFGHRVKPGENYGEGICQTQGEAILARDVQIAEEAIARLVKVPLAQGQFDALVDFVFNLGAGRLAGSTLLKYLNAGEFDAAAWQLLAWDHAGSHEVAGLKNRREAEFNLWSLSPNQKTSLPEDATYKPVLD